MQNTLLAADSRRLAAEALSRARAAFKRKQKFPLIYRLHDSPPPLLLHLLLHHPHPSPTPLNLLPTNHPLNERVLEEGECNGKIDAKVKSNYWGMRENE
jgi:hypothetical protein